MDAWIDQTRARPQDREAVDWGSRQVVQGGLVRTRHRSHRPTHWRGWSWSLTSEASSRSATGVDLVVVQAIRRTRGRDTSCISQRPASRSPHGQEASSGRRLGRRAAGTRAASRSRRHRGRRAARTRAATGAEVVARLGREQPTIPRSSRGLDGSWISQSPASRASRGRDGSCISQPSASSSSRSRPSGEPVLLVQPSPAGHRSTNAMAAAPPSGAPDPSPLPPLWFELMGNFSCAGGDGDLFGREESGI